MYLKELNLEEKGAFYSLAQSMVAADGVFGDEEKVMMSQYLQEMNITRSEAAIMTEAAALEVFTKSPNTTKRKVFVELVSLSLCDGTMEAAENQMLVRVSKIMGFSRHLTNQLIDCVKLVTATYDKMSKLINS